MGREAAIRAVAPWLYQIRGPRVPQPGGGLFLGWLCSPDTPRQPFWLRRGASLHPRLGLVFLPPPASASTRPRTHPPAGLRCFLCLLLFAISSMCWLPPLPGATASAPPGPGPPRAPRPVGCELQAGGLLWLCRWKV